MVGIGIKPLSSQEQRLEAGEVISLQQGPVRVFLLDGPKSGGRGEHDLDFMLGNDPPESARIRGADGFALINDGRAAIEQWRIHDIGMAHHPAHIRGGPVDITGFHVIDIFHGPVHGHGMTAVIPHDALGHAGGAGGVKNVQGVGGGHRHAVGRLRVFDNGLPFHIPLFGQFRLNEIALEYDTLFRLVTGLLDGRIDHRFIGQGLFALDGAGGDNNSLGLGMIDTDGQLVGGKSPEDHGMDGAQPGTGEHRDQGLGNHRHIDNDGITLFYTLIAQGPGKNRHLLKELFIGNGPLGPRDWRIVDNGRLIATAVFHMPVNGIVAGIQFATSKPAVDRRIGTIKHRVPFLIPINAFGSLGPKFFRMLYTFCEYLFVSPHLCSSFCLLHFSVALVPRMIAGHHLFPGHRSGPPEMIAIATPTPVEPSVLYPIVPSPTRGSPERQVFFLCLISGGGTVEA